MNTEHDTEVKSKKWVVGFGPIEGMEGDKLTVAVEPKILFRGELLVLTGDQNIHTKIIAVRINGKEERLEDANSDAWFEMTGFNGTPVMNCDLNWSPCLPDANIEIDVEFLKDAVWIGTVIGNVP